MTTIREKYIKSLNNDPNKHSDWRTDKSVIGHGVCPYCGKKVQNKKDTYCKRCLEDGFDEVHRMFGTSNGWDRRPIRAIPPRDGWR